jgi:phage N-6-adenine-methyltransferase
MLHIDPELANLCPPLSPEEYATLEESILDEGCRDALVVWAGHDILLDGHNRKRICDEYGLSHSIIAIELPDRDAAIDWILRNQLGRRNLHPDAASLMRGRLYNMQKRDVGRPRQLDQSDPIIPESTAERLSTELGVSAPTIKRDGKFAEAVDTLRPFVPDIDHNVLSGNIPSRQVVIEAAKEPERATEILAKPHVAHNSGDNEWYTPEEYIVAAKAVMGNIDLDPASSTAANTIVGATYYYSKENDGLTQPWAGRIWMNPPYAQPTIQQFCDKLAEERENITEAIVLVNNATETRWFQGLASMASAICFPQGRVRFWAPDKTSAAPLQGQAILYIGRNSTRFLEEFQHFGFVVTLGAHICERSPLVMNTALA